LFECDNSENSYFCSKSTNLKNCLFCYNIHDCEYYIFNKPVSEKIFNLILKQYKDFSIGLNFINSWPEQTLIAISVFIKHNYSKYYEHLSEDFWKWASTLPGYDSKVLYNITLNSKFL
jgi:hypothetical protein